MRFPFRRGLRCTPANLRGTTVPRGRLVRPPFYPHIDVFCTKRLCGADFKVTEELPGVTFALPNNYAGNIKVQRPNHDNDTLFFWGWERWGANGSLTAPQSDNNTDPWLIWLQGGCVLFA